MVTAMARRVRLEYPVFSSREETKRFTVREEMPSSAAISSYSSPSHTSRSTSISRGVSWVLLTCPRRVSGVRSG